MTTNDFNLKERFSEQKQHYRTPLDNTVLGKLPNGYAYIGIVKNNHRYAVVFPENGNDDNVTNQFLDWMNDETCHLDGFDIAAMSIKLTGMYVSQVDELLSKESCH